MVSADAASGESVVAETRIAARIFLRTDGTLSLIRFAWEPRRVSPPCRIGWRSGVYRSPADSSQNTQFAISNDHSGASDHCSAFTARQNYLEFEGMSTFKAR